MLKIDLLGLQEGINPLELAISGDTPLFRQLDVELAGEGTLIGTIDKRGDDLYVLSFSVHVPVNLSCRRCLDVYVEEVQANFMLAAMKRQSGVSHGYDEEDVLCLEPDQRELDLDGVVREYFLLNLPPHPLCSEDCRGLCPGCGVDLNKENCSCVE
jgi:uncharacterized protein